MINIWEDRWLNDEQMGRIVSPKPRDSTLMKVKDLMNQERAGWNQTLLTQPFSAEEIQVINRTPIGIMGISDCLDWIASKHGQYTVSSGYKVAKICGEKAKREVGTSTRRNEEERNLWKGIWSMNVKKKLQHFIWRACYNRLPVSSSLRKKGIELDKTFKLCGKEKETVEHLFFH